MGKRIKMYPPSDRPEVNAIKVTRTHATCPCGTVIKLKRDGPILHVGNVAHLPTLVGTECPSCGAMVRIDGKGD